MTMNPIRYDRGRRGVVIPRGTRLYRLASRLDYLRAPHECPDTGKDGRYFATYPLLALAIAVEQELPASFLGVFEVLEDMHLDVGKYSFRHLEPDLFFRPDGSMIFDVRVPPRLNVGHFEDLLPIMNPDWDSLEAAGRWDDIFHDPLQGEVFVPSQDVGRLREERIIALPSWLRIYRMFIRRDYFARDVYDAEAVLGALNDVDACTGRHCRRRLTEGDRGRLGEIAERLHAEHRRGHHSMTLA